MMRRVLVALATALILAPDGVAADGRAPGAPGGRTAWAPADKVGFGTAHSRGYYDRAIHLAFTVIALDAAPARAELQAIDAAE